MHACTLTFVSTHTVCPSHSFVDAATCVPVASSAFLCPAVLLLIGSLWFVQVSKSALCMQSARFSRAFHEWMDKRIDARRQHLVSSRTDLLPWRSGTGNMRRWCVLMYRICLRVHVPLLARHAAYILVHNITKHAWSALHASRTHAILVRVACMWLQTTMRLTRDIPQTLRCAFSL